MSKVPRVASALSFAHMFGIGSMRGKKARAEDEEDEREKGSRAEDDQDDEDEDDKSDKTDKKSRKAKRAKAGEDADEDEKDDEDPEDEDEDEDEDDEGEDKDKGKKSKRAKADEDDADAEDDEEEMHGKSAAAAARRRERARCAEIFGSRYAARNPVLAANLAFNTAMTRAQAINVLRDTPAGGDAKVNSTRSGKNPVLGSDGGESPSRTAAIAGRWDRAMSKVRGK